jgi:hypothetical protein
MVDCSFSYFDSIGSIVVELELLSMVPVSTLGCAANLTHNQHEKYALTAQVPDWLLSAAFAGVIP